MHDYSIQQVHDLETAQRLVRVIHSLGEMRVHQIIADLGMILDHHFSYCDRDSQQGQNVYIERHSRYFLSFRSLARDQYICGKFAEMLLACSGMKLDEYDVMTPETLGGYFLGQAVSRLKPNKPKRHLTAKVDEVGGQVFQNDNRLFIFRCGEIVLGDEVVVINDVDRSGPALEGLIKIARQLKGKVNKVLVFATWNYKDFQKRMAALGVEGYALFEFQAPSWTKEYCPECWQRNRGEGEYRELIPASEMS